MQIRPANASRSLLTRLSRWQGVAIRHQPQGAEKRREKHPIGLGNYRLPFRPNRLSWSDQNFAPIAGTAFGFKESIQPVLDLKAGHLDKVA